MKSATLTYLARLSATRLPSFVGRMPELRKLKRLQEHGYVEASFYPPKPCKSQFACARHLTPQGQALLELIERRR
ncbi:hypothetical protein [Variovorax sp. DT-64]|uniref:hypothetical protein n=1 Tax=Variovorax sp. DT-64 TaxID=3396160 RepID=UPI003F1A1487